MKGALSVICKSACFIYVQWPKTRCKHIVEAEIANNHLKISARCTLPYEAGPYQEPWDIEAWSQATRAPSERVWKHRRPNHHNLLSDLGRSGVRIRRQGKNQSRMIIATCHSFLRITWASIFLIIKAGKHPRPLCPFDQRKWSVFFCDHDILNKVIGYIGYRFCFISGNVDYLWSRNCLLPRKLHVQARLFGLNHQTVAGDRVSGGDRGDYPVPMLLLLLLLLLLPLLLVVVYWLSSPLATCS